MIQKKPPPSSIASTRPGASQLISRIGQGIRGLTCRITLLLPHNAHLLLKKYPCVRQHMAFHVIDQRQYVRPRCLTAVDDEVRMLDGDLGVSDPVALQPQLLNETSSPFSRRILEDRARVRVGQWLPFPATAIQVAHLLP